MMLNINSNTSIRITNTVVGSAAEIIITQTGRISAKNCKCIINKTNTTEELAP